jgi:hypothetical protein
MLNVCADVGLVLQIEREDSGRPVPVAVMKGAPEVIRQHLKSVSGSSVVCNSSIGPIVLFCRADGCGIL